MDKEAVNNLIINGLKSKGIFIGSIAPEVLEAFSKMMYKAINYTRSCKSDSEQLVCDDNELDCPYEFTSRCTMGRCGCKPKAN
tara:strand:- start:319 stop:567 length:249 start_codon:yes stop_codon:yes gene_type:complete